MVICLSRSLLYQVHVRDLHEETIEMGLSSNVLAYFDKNCLQVHAGGNAACGRDGLQRQKLFYHVQLRRPSEGVQRATSELVAPHV